MKKRLLSLLLALSMLLSLLPAPVLAAERTSGSASASGSSAASGVSANPFTDVKEGSWYYDAVQYVRVNGIFNGTSETTFTPNGTLTRGMFVTVLGRMAGVKAADYTGASGFADVSEDSYCAPFVKWAVQYGITTGTGDGKFSPNAPVTREQMAAFLVRYFEAFGVSYETGANVTTQPADLANVSDWARDAVSKLWKQGLLNGDGTNFNPKNGATRAETAAVCMRLDRAVKTWYSAPGVESDRVSVDPAADTKPADPNNNASAGGDSDSSSTSYYEVSFALGEQAGAGEVTLPEKQTVKAGTRISELPTPTQTGGVFLGWYYDSALTRAAGANDTVNRNMTLYAKMGEVMAVNANEAETPNYVTVTVPAASVSSYTFKINGYTDECIASFIQVTANNETVAFTVSNGVVSFPAEQGQTYRVELKADSDARFVVNGTEQAQSVRVLNIVTEKGEVDNLSLSEQVKYIPKKDVTGMSESLDGLFRTSLKQDAEGNTQPVSKVDQTGSFTYAGGSLAVGDTVAIYEGVSPADRDNSTDNDGAVAYVQITAVSGNTYTYKTADSADVLFTPDVLPFPTDQGWDTDGNPDDKAATVRVENMTYTDDEYAELGLDSQTTIDAGDFLAFYTGALGGESKSQGYAEITSVETITQDGEEYYVLTYKDAAEADVFAAMDLYSTRDEEIELTDAQARAIEKDMVKQASESGFAEQAAQYLTELALETDGFQELSDMGLASYSITADGEPVQGGIATYGATTRPILDKDHINISATVNVGSLKHFADRYGIRAELSIEFSTTVEGKNGNSIEISMTAVFEQEVLLTVNTSGGAIWKWKWIFPYIYDYRLNANIDVGTYTGIAITATAKTAGEDDDGFDWEPVTDLAPEEKIINIGQQIKDLMEQKESFFGEDVDWKAGEGGGLAEKYSAMMEDADESWIDLVRKEIFAQEGNVDPFHILCYGISADFVVKANLYVTMGMSFEFGVARRYNFSIMLFHKQSTNETIDLEEAHYNFDFYVMGTIGVRVGVEFEIGVGLFSLKLDSIGITAEAGAYAQLWGYFYYHLSWTKSGGKDSNAAGAMYVEIGLYLTVTFKAQLFSSDKLTYQPVLYDGQWPLWSAGAQNNVYDFAYDDDDDQLDIDIKSVRTLTLPSSLFDMSYMDMKTGEIYDGDENPAGNYDDATESHFVIELSNSAFRYNPANNTITIQPGDGVVNESCDMTIRWKNGALAFTSEPIQRTLHIEWSDPANVQYYAFDSNGGSYVPMIVAGAGAAIDVPAAPTKQGYTFVGWYSDSTLKQRYSIPSVMPAFSGTKGMTLYAKWEPAQDTPYKVEHYLQELNGTYTLEATENRQGTTLEQTYVSPRTGTVDGVNYSNYTCSGVTQQTIKADGSTVVQVYYERKTYDVTFTYGAFRGEELPDIVYTIKYGGTAYAPTLALQGYDFGGFSGFTADAESGGMTVTGNMNFAAQWTPRSDTAYRIERYAQRVDGVAGYLLIDDEQAVQSLTGTTGDSISFPDAWSRDGFTYDHAETNGSTVTSAAIGADGKTVVKLYYNRAQYNLTLAVNDGTDTATATKMYFGARIRVSELKQPTRDGYVFRGWFTSADCAEENAFTGGTMPVGGLTLYAAWDAGKNTAYQVEHYFQNADGTYPDAASQTENLTGTTLETATAAVQSVAGYHEDTENANAVKSGTIAADGSLVLKVYYARNTYTLTFKNAGEDDFVSILRWGERITAPALTVTKPGYALSWSPALPETMPQSDSTYTAVWTAGTSTAYTLTCYKQDADTGLYEPTVETLYGTTDTEVTATRSFDHYTLNEALSTPSGVIAGDGSLQLTLYFDLETLTVTFDAGEGGTLTDEAEKTFRYGQTFSVTDPERADYSFTGWYLPDGSEFNADTVTKDMALTAHWGAQPVAFTVEHYYMDTDGRMPNSASESNQPKADVDTDIVVGTLKKSGLSEAFTCVKAVLSGAYGVAEDTEITDLNETVRVTKGMTVKLYYDRAQYTLTWDFDGGTADNDDYTGSSAYEVYYDTELVLPTLTKRGHDFLGWYDEAGSQLAAGAKMPAAAQTYHAKWTPSVYQIKYENLENGTFDVELPTTHTYGTDTSLPRQSQMHRTGYISDGWRANGTLLYPPYQLDAEAYTADITLTALWTVIYYSITYELDGGVNAAANPKDYTVNQTVTLEAPTRPGYTFKGWYADKDFQTPVVGIPAGSTEAKTFYAKWELNPYTITWDVDGGDELTGDSYTTGAYYGDPITKPADPTRTGYAFTGWKPEVPETMPDGDQTFTAQWSLNTYTITYVNVEGASNSNPASYTVEMGGFALADADKTGYTFDGWYSDDTYSTKVTTIPAGSTGNKTFYAKWTVNRHTITWNANGGTLNGAESSSVSAEFGSSVSAVKPADPTKAANEEYTYTFAGWYTDAGCTTALGENDTVPDKDMMLYAKWTQAKQQYTITWINEDETVKSSKYDHGTRIYIYSPSVSKAGGEGYTYKLEGWYTKPDGAGDKLYSDTTVTGDATYYANWTKVMNTYTVKFDLNGPGGTIASQTVTHGETLTTPDLPQTAQLYGDLLGWYNGNSSWSFSDPVTGSMTLTAKWGTLYGYSSESLQNALANTPAGGTVKITQNFELTANIRMNNKTMKDNVTIDGGGFTVTASSSATNPFYIWTDGMTSTIKNLTIDGNSVGTCGIWITKSNVKLENVTVKNFDAGSNGDGGGMQIGNGDNGNIQYSVTAKNCTFTNNKAYRGAGLLISAGNIDCTNCTFSGNATSSGGKGGAMYIIGPSKTSTFTGGSFTNNSAKDGGALFLEGNASKVTISNASFSGNTASGNRNEYAGGNIAYLDYGSYFEMPTLTLSGCTGTVTNGTYTPTSRSDGTRIES